MKKIEKGLGKSLKILIETEIQPSKIFDKDKAWKSGKLVAKTNPKNEKDKGVL